MGLGDGDGDALGYRVGYVGTGGDGECGEGGGGGGVAERELIFLGGGVLYAFLDL